MIFALLLAAVALAACGGDDETTSSSTTDTTQGTPLDSADFTAQANAICKEGNEEVDAALANLPADADESDILAAVSDTVLPSIEDQINQIQALGIPEGEVADVDAFIESAQDALAEAEADPSLLVPGEGGTAGPFEDVNKQAEALGLTECAG